MLFFLQQLAEGVADSVLSSCLSSCRDLSRILVHFRSLIGYCSDSKTNDIGLIKVVLHAGFLTGVEYNRANIIATKRENLWEK